MTECYPNCQCYACRSKRKAKDMPDSVAVIDGGYVVTVGDSIRRTVKSDADLAASVVEATSVALLYGVDIERLRITKVEPISATLKMIWRGANYIALPTAVYTGLGMTWPAEHAIIKLTGAVNGACAEAVVREGRVALFGPYAPSFAEALADCVIRTCGIVPYYLQYDVNRVGQLKASGNVVLFETVPSGRVS